MSTPRPYRRKANGLITLAFLLLMTVSSSVHAVEGTPWLAAYQAYLRHDYAAAHAGFAQLLQGELTAADRAEILWYDTCSLRELTRPADAAATMEALLQIAPHDPHFEGLAFLYRYYLDTEATAKAETLWQTVVARWGKTAGLWTLVAERADYLAQRDPELVVACADQLAPLTIAKENLIVAFYQPLFKYGHFTKAKAVHATLQQYFAKHRPAAVELDKRAYEEAISDSIIESYFIQFNTALEAGDLEAARIWLANLNGTVPEHPRAVEARKQFREITQTTVKER